MSYLDEHLNLYINGIKDKDKEMASSITLNIDAIQAQINRLAIEAARLEALPSEPELDVDGDAVIWFSVKYNNSDKNYVYVAVWVADKERWYVTGSIAASYGYTWDQLLVRYFSSNNVWQLYKADKFKFIAASE